MCSQAQTYDLEHQKTDPHALRRSTWHVYAHQTSIDDFLTNYHVQEQFYDSIYFAAEEDPPLFDLHNELYVNQAFQHNIDTPIYELNTTRQIDQTTQLPKPIYQTLDQVGKCAWFALPDSVKRQLVRHLPQPSNPYPPGSYWSSPSPGPPPHHSVNFMAAHPSSDAAPASSRLDSDFDAFVAAFRAFPEDGQTPISSQNALQAHQHQQSNIDANFFEVMQVHTANVNSTNNNSDSNTSTANTAT